MRKLLKALFLGLLVAVPIGLVAMWKTGNLCSTSIQMSIGYLLSDLSGGSSRLNFTDEGMKLREKLVPGICSGDSFDSVFQKEVNDYNESVRRRNEYLTTPQ